MRATDVLFAILSLISVVGMVTLAIWTFAEEWSVQRFRDIPAYKGRSTVTLGRLLNPIEVELSDLCPWSVEIDEHVYSCRLERDHEGPHEPNTQHTETEEIQLHSGRIGNF